ncbi:protein of unknown function [Xylanibacter ruminicola]|uniref:DUF4831 domain-containing protein n=1 Tax=Xylanibacter ruminicola TaxID=839 RepID=A0A1H5X0Z2_XYLRU|nr:DUF4831 family protein [Xylanibacter ruminicola]SEG04916.1 protein of unknown function [Xylanibacter ruminicola]
MRRFLSTLFVISCSLHVFSQTLVASYHPGVTSEGAIYYLPKTALRITVQVERSSFTPGEFCKYAERYLRMKDVITEPAINYSIITIQQEPVAVADTSKCYAIKFDARTSACNVRLSADGILLGINTDEKIAAPWSSAVNQKKNGRKELINPRSYLSEEILAAGSTAKMAELIAQEIYEIRESRNLLTRGQADYMPKDGEQLRLMLNKLEEQNLALTSLFTGVTVSDTTEYTFTITPNKDIENQILFRLSDKLGIVDADDLAGVPYYINIENLKTVPPVEVIDPKKKQKQANGVYVNIPGKLRSTISNVQGMMVSNEFPAGQFGNVELLSGALFNKRYTTHLQLHPISGAVEKLQADQPK